MNYNPYAPPQAAPPNLAPPQPGAGAPQPWEIGEVINQSFEAFKANWVVLVFSHLLTMVFQMVPSMVPGILVATGAIEPFSGAYYAMEAGVFSVVLVMYGFFYVGLYRISLAAARGQQAEFGMLFSGADRFGAMLATLFLLGVILLPATALFIVPGVILSLGLFQAVYFVVDQGMGPIDALKASWAATTGHKAHLFLFGLLAFVMMIGGYVACFVGIFAVLPIISVAMAIIYLRISGRSGPPAFAAPMAYPGQPYQQGYGPPPGGYGPQGAPPGGYGGPPQGGYGGPQGGYGGPQGGGGPPGGGGQGGPPPGGYGPPGGYNPGGGGGYGPGGGGGPPPQGY